MSDYNEKRRENMEEGSGKRELDVRGGLVLNYRESV